MGSCRRLNRNVAPAFCVSRAGVGGGGMGRMGYRKGVGWVRIGGVEGEGHCVLKGNW